MIVIVALKKSQAEFERVSMTVVRVKVGEAPRTPVRGRLTCLS